MARKTIHFVSLGCPKNRVDSEVMLGVAERAGYRHVPDAADASVIVVNTCGFIDAAKKESIDTILELGRHKESGSCQKLVVAGCLSQRHPDELADGLPEVDHLLGSSDMLKLEGVLTGKAERILVGSPADWVVKAADPRTISTRGASAYVKIAEGCNRKCSFCVIPELRGLQRSRSVRDVVEEVKRLADAGVLEVNLVSQDTVAYGRDLPGDRSLAQLVERVAAVSGIRWVRLFYLYPEKLGDELIELIGHHERVVPYVDMPLQHAADAMLRRMRRGHGGARLRELVSRLRERVPNLTFRTAFIVGHPGESEAEFEELCDFVRWARFDRMGVFRYSDEESSKSYHLADKVPPRVAASRAKKLMAIQRKISREKQRALIGQELTVLVEGPSEESELVMVGRHAGQAPEIDGQVFLSGAEVRPGQMRRVRIERATDYDLLGEVIDEEPSERAPRRKQPGAPVVHRESDGRKVGLRVVT
ncbi:MAG: 30S ribosomal protein S12 methylthiotransferase RimO [Polyangiaceae bacterium]|nr:30S ribosomal protein S12 methylthiotransferase RimO [Polyangiaceae bacterium]MCE7891140.1 30S ribosomal protein S12 methylthiotransferase RimO [Sorangiineae bacterium PRO1]MCL4751261.1 30S ribosomal protein S12 methylthiotransferase RimO [Myxococcales bacterium]